MDSYTWLGMKLKISSYDFFCFIYCDIVWCSTADSVLFAHRKISKIFLDRYIDYNSVNQQFYKLQW